LLEVTADEYTTREALLGTFVAACPMKTFAPNFSRRRDTSDALRSDPETWNPEVRRISARPDIPEPPIPMK
jgi:hypothetical protein